MHVFATLLLAVCSLCGTWQGLLQSPEGALRRVMEITQREPGGAMHATIHSIDETDVPIVSKTITVKGSRVIMTFDMNTAPWLAYRRRYVATLNAGSTTMSGSWTGSGVPPLSIAFTRVAHVTWPIFQPKRVQMVTVAPGVKDEVLDWGGSGRPVLLLAGLGNTAHDFYTIVPDLMKHYRVYSMTRRGFGNSSAPPATTANYSPDRLGDDVIAVMTALRMQKPVLIGHSIAGEELSDIATRYPTRVAGLVYLEAGYWYALNDGTATPVPIGTPPPGLPPLPPAFYAILHADATGFPGPFNVPILTIFADPHAKAEASDKADMDAYIARWRRMVPSATVIAIPNASHYIYISNKPTVLRAINAFISKLPR
ncbi:MAG TPA: alpha/beta hydrolase [Candidatus Baltobacteraceae bacterium]|nr:alpha/beta hydrolase [Candidatus Baltobacteraceae bacterium]